VSPLSSSQTDTQPVAAQCPPRSVASSRLLAGLNRLEVATMELSLVDKLKVIFVVGVVLSKVLMALVTCCSVILRNVTTTLIA